MTLPPSTSVYAEQVEVTSLKVCINVTVNTTLSDWHIRVIAQYGRQETSASHFTELDRWNNPVGVAKAYRNACFEADAPAGKLPSNAAAWDAAEPFTGLWASVRSNMLSGYAENNYILAKTQVNYRIKIFDRNGVDPVSGTLEGWSAEICVQTLEAPANSTWPSCVASPELALCRWV